MLNGGNMQSGLLAQDFTSAVHHATALESRERIHLATVSGYLENRAKRIVELVLVSMLLIPALPLCLLIASAILIADGRPVLFAQRRCGRGSRPFALWKFRTLHPADQAEEYSAESQLRNRYTRIGGFLRRRRLDELSQLLAVLIGQGLSVWRSQAITAPRKLGAFSANRA